LRRLGWAERAITRTRKLEFRLLGPLEVWDENGLVSLGTPQQRALLALLLLNANHVVSRDRLIDELWGHEAPPTAVKLVQLYVSRLRKALEPDILVTKAPGYMVRIGGDELDLHRAERLVASGRQALADGKPQEAAERLREALALWRGPPLAEFAFERFAEREIGRLDELRLATLEDRIDADLALGHSGLVGELEGLIAHHPLRERLRGQLMLALYRSGRQSEALEAYRDTRRTLVEEVGVEPGPALKRLEREILAQDPGLEAPAREPPTPSRPAAALASHDEFVGRHRELGALVSGLDDALAGRGAVLLIAGEAGIGKSRLLDELARHAAERGARVLWGRCWEAGGAPAYWPWVQSFRAYVEARDRDELRDELGAHPGELATLLPELRELFDDLPAPVGLEAEAARFRLFEAVASFLVEAAHAQPLVLVLDDLHAADEPSLLLLQFLGTKVGGAAVLVVGAYRDVELEADTPLASVVAELGRERTTRQLELGGLSESEVGRLIESNSGSPAPERSLRAIHRGTEGNPLFVGEIVRLLSSEGRLAEVDLGATDALPLGPGVREVIGRRLRHLSEDGRSILALASVLGREFEFNALMHLSGRPEDELLDALEEALATRVISEVPGAPDRLRFAHALIRDTLYGGLSGPRRQRLHREAGEALEALYAADRELHLAELAHHFVAAGRAGDEAMAIDYARRAGDRAVRLLAWEEAIRLYRLALDALTPATPTDDELRCRLLLALGEAQARAGDDREAKSTLLRAAELAKARRLPELLARAAAAYGGRLLWMRALTDERLVPLLEDALAALEDDDSVLRVQLLSRLAAARRGEPSRQPRERLRDEALRGARRIGDPATLAYAIDATLAAVEGPLNVDEQVAQSEELIALATAIGDPERLFGAHEHMFWNTWTLGDPDRRASALESMIGLAEELRQPAQLWLATAAKAAVALADGRFALAEQLIERAVATGERALSWSTASTRMLQLLVLHRERGTLDDLEGMLGGSTPTFHSPLVRGSVLSVVNAWLGRDADVSTALDELGRHDISKWHVDEEWLLCLCLLAEACDRTGAIGFAERLYRALRPYGALNAVGVGEVGLDSVSRSLGVLATILGHPVDAADHFEAALVMNTRMGTAPGVAHTQLGYARMLVGRGDQADEAKARELAGSAQETYRGLGMKSFATEAEELARVVLRSGP
jgi:DNA-binding SARP family transcriptional activator